jgi:tRNA1Val (adenine37-N6)-methyltransferase
MKVGTDGVLLGAWTPIENNPFSILILEPELG